MSFMSKEYEAGRDRGLEVQRELKDQANKEQSQGSRRGHVRVVLPGGGRAARSGGVREGGEGILIGSQELPWAVPGTQRPHMVAQV